MFICHADTNHVFLLSLRRDPLPHSAGPAPSPGSFALISKWDKTNQNQLRISFDIQSREFMSIYIVCVTPFSVRVPSFVSSAAVV